MEALANHGERAETISGSGSEGLPVESGAAASTVDHQAAGEGQSRHGFPQLAAFSDGEMRKVKLRQEEFIRSLETRLSAHLRLECGLQLARCETLRFREFMGGLSAPTQLTLLEIEPLDGFGFLNIPARLALTIAERELGGPARKQEEARELSGIEVTVLARVVEIIANEWCAAWRDLLDLRPKLLRQESDGRALQMQQPEDLMFMVGVEIRLGEAVEEVRLALLFSALKPLLKKLNSAALPMKKPVAAPAEKPLSWNPELGDVELQITAELADLMISARQLGELKAGDVIPVPAEAVSRVQVSLAATPKFMGSLGTCEDRWAVQISKILRG